MDWWYCVEMDGRINKWIAGFWMWCRKKRDRENLILSMEAALRVLIFFQDCKKLRFQEGWSCLIFILSSVQKGFISLWISLPSKKYFKLPPFPVACFCQYSCLNIFFNQQSNLINMSFANWGFRLLKGILTDSRLRALSKI